MTTPELHRVEDGGIFDRRIRALSDAIIKDWPRIDAVWDDLRGRRGDIHLRRDTGLDSQAFLREAISVAFGCGLLRAFATRLITADLTDRNFRRRLEALLPASEHALQSFQQGVYLPTNAFLFGKGLLSACEHVCRIDIDEQHRGTGVLVRPSLVATAAHVVADLLAQGADGSLDLSGGSPRAAADSIGRLTLTFGDIEDYLPDQAGTYRRPGTIGPLHADWLAWCSPPTPNEQSTSKIDVLDIDGIDSDGPWDLALLRLAEPLKVERPAHLRASASPGRPFAIHVLHHPNGGTERGEPLLLSVGQMDRNLGHPPVRCLHNANTLSGSSGAPVYDRNWRIVALHQAGDRVLQSHTEASALEQSARNRAVPVRQWLPRLDAIERQVADVPYVRTLETAYTLTPFPYPVIGRRTTQQAVWRAMQPGAGTSSRLLILRGEPGTGRRFTRLLVKELVATYSAAFAALDMANVVDDAEGVTRRILGVLSEPLGTPLITSATTTSQRDLRDVIVPTLAAGLERLARGRPVWLLLEGLGAAAGEVAPGVRDIVLELVQHLGEVPSLRLVLVGWGDAPPTGYESSVEDLRLDLAYDVVQHLSPGGDNVDSQDVADVETALAALATTGLTGYPAAVAVVHEIERRRQAERPQD